MKWVIEYESGPSERVGPFDSEDAAEEWAASYAVEYPAAGGRLDLVWNTVPLTDPATLEWWT